MAGGEGHGAIGPLNGHGSAIDPIDHRILDLGEAIAREDVRSVASIARDLAALVRAHLPDGWDLDRLEGNGGVNDLRGRLDFQESPRHHAAAHILSLALYIESCPDQVGSAIVRTLAAHGRELSPEMLRGHKILQGAPEGGKAPKRKRWACRAVALVSCWEEIPGPEEAWEFEDLNVRIYRDGDQLCAADIDDLDKEIKTLARSSFERRYLR